MSFDTSTGSDGQNIFRGWVGWGRICVPVQLSDAKTAVAKRPVIAIELSNRDCLAKQQSSERPAICYEDINIQLWLIIAGRNVRT